nr:MAG TPA: hypothetical protein [Bacteriophage sp.]
MDVWIFGNWFLIINFVRAVFVVCVADGFILIGISGNECPCR